MNVLRRSFVYLLLAILALVVLLFTLGAISYVTVFDPSFFKDRLEASGIYEDMGNIQARLLFADLGEENEAVREAIEELTPYFQETLPAETVRDIADEVIDGVDGWLRVETPTPQFNIDTAAIRNSLNQGVTEFAKARMATLPACTEAMTEYNLLALQCRPPFAISDAQYMAYADTFTSELPFLDRDALTSASVIEDPNDPGWTSIPRTYWWGKVALIVFACVLILMSALAVATARHKQRALARLGGVATSVAVVLLIGAAIAGIWVAHASFGSLGADTPKRIGFADYVVLPVIHSLAEGIGMWMAVFGVVWALIAIALLVSARMLKRKKTDVAPTVIQRRTTTE